MTISTGRWPHEIMAALALVVFSASACTPGGGGTDSPAPTPAATSAPSVAGATPAPAEVASADPFAYCAQVGTIDAPDARYTGEKVPPAIAQGIKRATGAPADAPLDVFARNTSWRCMDGSVYACTVGANLPCGERADTGRTPSAAMEEFCRANADATVIPAFVTGRATVYAWRCAAAEPAIVRQVFEPDKRGFLADFWHELRPS